MQKRCFTGREHGAVEKDFFRKEKSFQWCCTASERVCARKRNRPNVWHFGSHSETCSLQLGQLLGQSVSGSDEASNPKEVQKHMPKSFKDFSNTRVVLDCTEVRIQKSSRLKAQKQTFSPYKHYNTCKALVGVTPDGYISFVPNLWGGRVSDSELVEKSGLVDLLQPGDAVMFDKGFRLDAVLPPTVTVHMPPFKKGSTAFLCTSNENKERLPSARIHVERVIRRIKEFHFLDRPIPMNMLDIADGIFQ
ncbi:hypothetical protein HPB48_026755 [Haemaphysalis longicornis]|uniref:DDE Tnp4 domain-containing protein n=1 Tax=Haemaphysalis longicornis TaxID=44386 RepID=A0A9J6HAA7_HAELO|nr:hypothetical protein HPB48_026755 [Haemaphysalis longicornis]